MLFCKPKTIFVLMFLFSGNYEQSFERKQHISDTLHGIRFFNIVKYQVFIKISIRVLTNHVHCGKI